MRNTAIAALLALGASVVTNVQASEIGMGVLMIWPTARSTALAGAMTGLADEVDATFSTRPGWPFRRRPRQTLATATGCRGCTKECTMFPQPVVRLSVCRS